jgi:antitoxin CptB
MDEARHRRIRFRAWRRGFREADLILGPFADQRVASMSEAQLERFETLLEQSDHDIYAWILGASPVPSAFDNDILAALKAFEPRASDAVRGG